MAFFGDKKNKRSNAAMANKGNRSIEDQINLVGEGTVFEGTLRAESDVRASGRIVGKLHVEGRAIVAESGAVEGEVRSTNADIAGTVQGEIYVEERLVLKSTARVDGNIQTDRLVVEEGAVFTGECKMGEAIEADASSSESASSGAASASSSSSGKGTGSPSKGASSGSETSKGSASKSGTSKDDRSKGGASSGKASKGEEKASASKS